MSAGDRPHLGLTAEPLPYLRARLVGRPVPGGVQPADHRLALEEEPALRIHLAGGAASDMRRRPAAGRPPRADGGDATPPLPATGVSFPLPLALAAVGLAWVLRQRQGPPGS